MSAPHPMAREILDRLRSEGVQERREVAVTYFPTRMEVYGTPVPALQRIVREALREMGGAPDREVLELAGSLIASGSMEGRQAAYEILDHHGEAASLLRTRRIETLGRGMDNWGSVDTFSVLVAGPAWREGRLTDAAVLRWARRKDRWWRRAALVSTVPLNLASRGGRGDTPRTLRICRELVADRDDMVVKALSWALRALIPRDEGAVRAFLREYGDTVHPRVRREVANKLATGKKSG